MAEDKDNETTFKEVVKDSLKNETPLQFQNAIRTRLADELSRQAKTLFEQSEQNGEMSVVAAIQNAARSYGASDMSYNEGVLTLTVPGKDAALHLIDYLEENDDVDSYDLTGETADASDDDPIDLEALSNDYEVQFEFEIYINPDLVQLDAEDVGEADEDEEPGETTVGESVEEEEDIDTLDETPDFVGAEKYLLEAKRIVVVRGAKKIIKMQCGPGQKWDPKHKKCVKLTSKELRDRKLGAKKGARKRRTKLVQINKKRAMSLKKRSSFGLKK